MVDVAPWYEMTFCSKMIFGKTLDHFTVSRDYKKTLFGNNCYTKTNAAIQNNPGLHPQATLMGTQAEKACRPLEMILEMRCD
jgi:hypothetical protein